MIDLSQWKALRYKSLAAADGWLNLTDRIPITKTPCGVGAAPDNDIRLTHGPAYLGRLLSGYRFETPDGVIQPFHDHGNPMLQVDRFLLEIHSSYGEPALRVRDLMLRRGVTLRYFPADPQWTVHARWEALLTPQPETIDQKGAGSTTVNLTHRAHFSHDGYNVTLLATHWKSSQPMFVIRDQTSGQQTYAAARFLLGEDMNDDTITLDFNKAHNPPCAFTDFAICPLPPRQNILPFAVLAGELSLI